MQIVMTTFILVANSKRASRFNVVGWCNKIDREDAVRNHSVKSMCNWRTLARSQALMVAALALILAALPSLRGAAAATETPDAHALHHHTIPPYARSTANYQVPDVTLVRADGKTVQLNHELDDGRPVVLSFIYTSCYRLPDDQRHAVRAAGKAWRRARSGAHAVDLDRPRV